MSKLYDVLEQIIEKVNKSVKFEEGQVLTDTEKQIVLTNLGLSTSSPAEPMELDVPRVYIDGTIPTTKDDVLAEMTYISETEKFHAYLEIKCQGTSSMSYPKKNFTVKLFEDEARSVKLKKDFRGWGAQNKFCLKANYIDCTHARNIICARLWSDACNTRENLNERLAAAPNNGAIDGFPIKLYANGVYQGLYTWNIPKDGWMFGMDKNGNEAVYCCEVQTEAGQFRQAVLADESDWSLEFPDADEVNASVLTGFNNLVRVVKDTTDDEFIAQLPTVLDIEAAIDYYSFCYYFCALDQLGKNMIMVTYDGGATWIPSAYDNDSTWGSYWDGNSMVAHDYACPENYECSASLLWERLESLFGERLYQRYLKLTGSDGPWSIPSIVTKIEEFYNIPRNELYKEDVEIYPGIPQGAGLRNMRTFMANRKPYVDNCLYEIGVYISLEGIEFQKASYTLGAGESVRLRLIYTPENARNKNVTITSSDSSYLNIERDGDFVILTVPTSLTSQRTVTVTATAEEDSSMTATLTITAQTAATHSHTAPVITFDSDDFSNGTWIDSTNNKSMVFSGTPTKNDNGVYFDGNTTFYFENYEQSNSDISIEFLGTLDDEAAGHNVLAISPDTSFSWSNIYGMWTAGNGAVYTQHCTASAVVNTKVKDSKRFVHFLLCCSAGSGVPTVLYANVDGRLTTTPGITGTTAISNNYIGNAEGTNHFFGSIRKLNVYNYVPTKDEVREILYMPPVVAYTTATITASEMEIGSLTNYEPYGQIVAWDYEVRTKNYIELPAEAEAISLDQVYGTSRLYFFNEKYSAVAAPTTLSSAGQQVSIPTGAKYIKFLYETTVAPDTVITYYK